MFFCSCKTGKTKSTEWKNEKYRINTLQHRNEKYKEGVKKNGGPLFFLLSLNRQLSGG